MMFASFANMDNRSRAQAELKVDKGGNVYRLAQDLETSELRDMGATGLENVRDAPERDATAAGFRSGRKGPADNVGNTSSNEWETTRSLYRTLPIFSGIAVPFSVLLAIPSVTGDWYATGNGSIDSGFIEIPKSPPWLYWTLGFSLACAVLANLFLVVRFMERMVRWTTIVAIVFLAIHDGINIVVLVLFGISYLEEGFTFGQPFWMTLCATVASSITNATLITDLLWTPDFAKSGSGLTRKQRSLIVIVIVLLFYIAFGSLIQTYMLKLSFIDALYFAVVSIETVGFGDIRPNTTSSRVFTAFYIVFGIFILGIAVAQTREVLLEAIVVTLQRRIRHLSWQDRNRRVHARWYEAVKWHLQAAKLPVWVSFDPVPSRSGASSRSGWTVRLKRGIQRLSSGNGSSYQEHRNDADTMRLNVEALTVQQLEAAALEAGAPLSELLPVGFRSQVPLEKDKHNIEMPIDTHLDFDSLPASAPPLTHVRIGNAARVLGSFAMAWSHGDRATHFLEGPREDLEGRIYEPLATSKDSEASLASMVAREEQLAFRIRVVAALVIFFVFWLVGSIIFMATEDWTFGTAVYFCFVTFTTVGYGELAPRTPAGRSIFVAWALLGVATMTTLISILTEAYSVRYKKAISSELSQVSFHRLESDNFRQAAQTQTSTRMDINEQTLGDQIRRLKDLVSSLSQSRHERRVQVANAEPGGVEGSSDGTMNTVKDLLNDLEFALREIELGSKGSNPQHDGIVRS